MRLSLCSIQVTYESDPEDEHFEEMMTVDDNIEPPVKRIRRTTLKKNWITPRICSALDKAKVRRLKLKN